MSTNAFDELFYREPYRSEAELRVSSCTFNEKTKLYHIACASTLFYPEGGGQAGDRGFLGRAAVLDTRYEDVGDRRQIMHICDRPLEPGTVVKAKIDWPRRFAFMQNHSGEHILSGLAHRHYGYNNVGFHLGEEDMTVDFDGPLSQEQLDELLKEANELVYADVPLETEVMPAEEAAALNYRSKLELTGPVRLIRIPNGDLCACCGTHVRRSGEIGAIISVKLENWKKGVRITLLCGSRAMAEIKKQQEILRCLSRHFSLPNEQIADGVSRLEDKLAAGEQLQRSSAEALWNKFIPAEGKRVVYLSLPLFDEHFARLTAKARTSGLLLIILPNGRFFLSEDEAEAFAIRLLREDCGARGGGPAQLTQGTLPAPEAEKIARLLAADYYEI